VRAEIERGALLEAIRRAHATEPWWRDLVQARVVAAADVLTSGGATSRLDPARSIAKPFPW